MLVPRNPCFSSSSCAAARIASRFPSPAIQSSLNELNEYHMIRSVQVEDQMADLVLLTGISGFLGGHVGLELLRKGFAVRGSVRNLSKADKVRATLAKAGADVSRLDFVELDLNSDAGWDAAMPGVRYLQHIASPFVTDIPKDKMELIRPAVDGTRRALTAALKANVERIVLTSSMAAIAYGHDKARTAPFTAADWTDLEGRG